MQAILALEDGTVFEGESFGPPGERTGEVVFNTSMTGYQEILTDPSYKGQIVVMTYPLIGNYGVSREDFESARPHVEGFVVREYSDFPSSWRSEGSLSDFLREYSIVGIEGIDTRALTRHIRTKGAMKGIVSTEDLDKNSLVERARKSPGLVGRDLVKEVTCSCPYRWDEPPFAHKPRDLGFHVVCYDFGVKHNILRMLVAAGCGVTVVPARTPAEEVLELQPDGILLSNGPGDPEGVAYAIENIRNLLDKKPIFGICLGHQILGLAFGGRTYKLKFGHHGGNHPVKDLATGRVQITVQNHGFAVDIGSLKDYAIELTHINLNDYTLEGMRHKELPIFSVQYHPEASPGPHDAEGLFLRFVELMNAQ